VLALVFWYKALDIAQPDVARAGGLTEIRRIAALTSAHGVRLAPHAWGSGVLFAASIHLAMAAPNCHIILRHLQLVSVPPPTVPARLCQEIFAFDEAHVRI
jgi:L-alanine-DL-glutamate epimerase-like enolase superfamily enzyme